MMNSFLSVFFIERANDIDVIQCHALMDGEPVLKMELGLVVSD